MGDSHLQAFVAGEEDRVMVGWWGVGVALLPGGFILGEGEGGLRDMWTCWDTHKSNWAGVVCSGRLTTLFVFSLTSSL